MVDLLLDIGQTSARARLVADDAVIGELHDLPGFVSGGNVCTSIEEAIGAAADQLEIPSVDRIAAGCSGLFGVVPSLDELGATLTGRYATRVLRVADDGVTAFLGALDDAPGAMAAAGTGIVALGLGPAGAARADGVGAMLGDNGSGWWIGRAGIIAALSAVDGRPDGSTPLLEAAVRRYGPPTDMPRVIAGSGTPIATTAAFAVDVAVAARAGDRVAQRIWQQAAEYIADAIIAVAARAGFYAGAAALRWSVIGRIADSRDLLEPVLSDRLLERFPDAHRIDPVAGPLEGIAHLLGRADLQDFGPMVAEFLAD